MDLISLLGVLMVAVGIYIKIQKKLTRYLRPTGPYPIKVVDAFDELLFQIKLSEWYKQEVEKAAEQICGFLDSSQRRSTTTIKYEIDSLIIAGSVGKGTAIRYSEKSFMSNDVDLIIYLNNSKPPFSNILKAFAEILEGFNEISGIIARQYSVEFSIWIKDLGDVKVDLLVATKDTVDCSKAVVDTATSQMDEKQLKQLLADRNKVVSCNFAPATVNLIQKFVRNKYVLNIVRLAKHWNSMVDMKKCGFIPARSYIIELVAIDAQQLVLKQNAKTDMISGFRRFLEKMGNFRKLDICLNKAIPEADEKFKKPIIRDPVNRFNNLTEGIPIRAMQTWEDQAKKTLDLLKRLRNGKIDFDLEENSDFINNIFSHKP